MNPVSINSLSIRADNKKANQASIARLVNRTKADPDELYTMRHPNCVDETVVLGGMRKSFEKDEGFEDMES